MAKHAIAIGLGSNLGDREANIRRAVADLAATGLDRIRLSGLHETAAVDCRPDAPNFLNAALTATTALAPAALLRQCLAVEAGIGRESRRAHGPPYRDRLIDLDILLVDDLVVSAGELVIPHPRLTERRFVLAPLAEVAPDWVVPPTGRTVGEWLERLGGDDA